MDPMLYEGLRNAMFGDRALSDWSDDDLADPEFFIDWAIEEAGIGEEYRAELAEVFAAELAGYLAEREADE